MKFSVVAATPDDAPVIATFNQLMALETEDKQLDNARILAGVRTMVSDTSLGQYLVARDAADAVVGCLGITYEWSDWRNGLFWWIQSVYVAEEARNHGVFTAMYQAVLDLCNEDKRCCGVRLYVERDNATAMRTYLRLGMEETEYRLMEVSFDTETPAAVPGKN